MTDDKHNGDKTRPKLQWTSEDRARHQAARDKFRDWHPSPEELDASGEGASFDLHGEYRDLRPFVEEIKRAREAAKLPPAVGKRGHVGKRGQNDFPSDSSEQIVLTRFKHYKSF
jgi:hypothetical protein